MPSLFELYPPSTLTAILWHEEGIDLYHQSDIMDRLSWLEMIERSILTEVRHPSYLWGFSDVKHEALKSVKNAIDNCNQCLGFKKCEQYSLTH